METSDFKGDFPGQLVPTVEGVAAFVPAPLPPRLSLDIESMNLLAEAENSLGRLAGTARAMNPHLVSAPLLRREAIVSSRMEGTIATPEQLAVLEASQESGEPGDTQTREVLNYVQAMNFGVHRMKTLPICLRLMRELHRHLMQGVRGERDRPGAFREAQNYIAQRSDDPISRARFVPPPQAEMMQALHDLESYLNGTDSLPTLIQAAVIHYQFETIHPFRDGNGRVGRLLIPLYLLSRKKLDSPVLYFSSYFEEHKNSYTDLMLRVSQTGDWPSWVKFFLKAGIECSQEALERAVRLQALRDQYHERFQSARSSALLHKLTDHLFEKPVITISQAARLLKITPAAASYNIQKLVEAGILHDIGVSRRPRFYRADEVLGFSRDTMPPVKGRAARRPAG